VKELEREKIRVNNIH